MPSNTQNMLTTMGLDPVQGTGSRTIRVTTGVNYGRNAKTGSFSGTTSSGASADCTIIKAGAPEFVEFGQQTYDMNGTQQTITVTGTSNSQSLTFSFTEQAQDHERGDEWWEVQPFVVIPGTYTVTHAGASITAVPGSDITGDPGGEGRYTFSITLALKTGYEATHTKEMTRFVVTGEDGRTSSCYIKRSLSSFINFNGNTNAVVNVGADETSTNVTLNSNDSWSLTINDI